MVTDRRRLGGADDAEMCARLVDLVGAAVQAGVDLVQIRERDLDGRVLVDLVERCVRAAQRTPTRVVVNDRLDVAMAGGAAGVHLRSDSIAVRHVRRVARETFLIGRSVHSATEAAAVSNEGGADYLLLGTVLPTSSKPGILHVAGLAELAAGVRAANIPVLAIGGVTLETLPEVARTGAAGFAAIGFFMEGAVDGSDSRLRDRVETARRLFDRMSTGS